MGRFFARSASDSCEDWPFWFVADRNLGGLNVTAEIIRAHLEPDHKGATLACREDAEALAGLANAALVQVGPA